MPKISSEKFQLRRQEIIDKAFELFSTKGYSKTSMDDLVKYTGISKGGLYTYFKSKEDIFLEIAEQRFQKRHLIVDQMSDAETSSEKVAIYLRWFLEGLQEESLRMGIRFTTEFWTILSRDKSKAHIALHRYLKFETDLEKLLLEGVQRGEFKQGLDTKSMVYIILSSLDGIAFIDSIMGIRVNEAAISEYVNMILNYLRG